MNVRKSSALVIHGGRIVDPYTGRDEIATLALLEGSIVDRIAGAAAMIDATDCIVCPGLMDIHVHLREPGFEHKETIETGTRAAAAGGFTYVACMPNTKPAIDTPDVVRLVQEKARLVNLCDVGVVAATTKERKGKEVTDFAALRKAGAIAFSDDGDGVEDEAVMRKAFAYAQETDSILIQHCEYQSISAGGVMHKGEVSRKLDLPGLDPDSEEAMIRRDLELCRETGVHYHVAHISTAEAVRLVKEAKSAGLKVTAEVCTHHLLLTDQTCASQGPNAKMHPPLRTEADVYACRQGLVDGTIDCIVTDHAPHAKEEKDTGMIKAPAGIVGLETAVGLVAKAMIETELADWSDLVRWFTKGAQVSLGLSPSPIETGGVANLTIIDPNKTWTVDPERFHSKSRNTPFAGWALTGDAVATIRGTRLTIKDEVRLRS